MQFMTIVLATTNKKKVEEMKRMFAGLWYTLCDAQFLSRLS